MKIEGLPILCDSDFEQALLMKADRFMTALGLPDLIEEYGKYVKQDMAIIKNGLRPAGVVAARIYMVCLLNNRTRTQEAIAEIAGISPSTIRMIFHKMNKRRRAHGL